MATLVLLRHAKALPRTEWEGEDEDRPLNFLGQRQAQKMAMQFADFGLKKIYTSDAVRCLDTIKEMGEALDLELEITKHLSEYVYRKKPSRAIDYAKEILYADVKAERNILVCSHNPVLPAMLERLLKHSKVKPDVDHLRPGEAWVLIFKGKKCIQVSHLSAPISEVASQ